MGQSPVGKSVSLEAEGTGEDTADWEDSVRAVVNCRVCELATALLIPCRYDQ
jgi:hypothetical protein